MLEYAISKLLSIAPTILTAVLIAAASSWITVRLSLARFRDEKWWEKKVESYERIIEALHHMKIDADASYNAFIEHRDIPEEKQKQLRAASSKAQLEVERAINIGSFTTSEECQTRLKEFLKELNASSNATDYFTHIDKYSFAIDKCLEDVIGIAKRDVRKP